MHSLQILTLGSAGHLFCLRNPNYVSLLDLCAKQTMSDKDPERLPLAPLHFTRSLQQRRERGSLSLAPRPASRTRPHSLPSCYFHLSSAKALYLLEYFLFVWHLTRGSVHFL